MQEKLSGVLGKLAIEKSPAKPIPFFDERYMADGISDSKLGGIHRDPRFLKSRSGAKRANAVTRALLSRSRGDELPILSDTF